MSFLKVKKKNQSFSGAFKRLKLTVSNCSNKTELRSKGLIILLSLKSFLFPLTCFWKELMCIK